MNRSGSLANSVPFSRTVISESTEAYVNSQHRMIRESLLSVPRDSQTGEHLRAGGRLQTAALN